MNFAGVITRIGIAAALAVSGISHAYLYIHGYQHIPTIGAAFVVQASISCALALLILIGGIFVIEALSVLIQIIAFQLFHKRVFLMAPIHHHFELKGWSETKIILRFWIVASICAAIGFTIYRQSRGV